MHDVSFLHIQYCWDLNIWPAIILMTDLFWLYDRSIWIEIFVFQNLVKYYFNKGDMDAICNKAIDKKYTKGECHYYLNISYFGSNFNFHKLCMYSLFIHFQYNKVGESNMYHMITISNSMFCEYLCKQWWRSEKWKQWIEVCWESEIRQILMKGNYWRKPWTVQSGQYLWMPNI